MTFPITYPLCPSYHSNFIFTLTIPLKIVFPSPQVNHSLSHHCFPPSFHLLSKFNVFVCLFKETHSFLAANLVQGIASSFLDYFSYLLIGLTVSILVIMVFFSTKQIKIFEHCEAHISREIHTFTFLSHLIIEYTSVFPLGNIYSIIESSY